MKKSSTISFLIFFFIIGLISCEKIETKNPFIVQVDDKRIELILENNADYLIYDTPIKAEFVFENIELNTWFIMGRGIRIVDFKNNKENLSFKSITEINYPSERSTSDTLEIELKFKGLNDTEYSNGIINVPVKRLNK
jgi:hypothetical protein